MPGTQIRLLFTMGAMIVIVATIQSSFKEREHAFCNVVHDEVSAMNPETASAFAKLALKGLRKEYPNKPADVLNSPEDVRSPKAMHPAFYGCFDWHSAVHGHWMLVRLLRMFPDVPERGEIRAALKENLSEANLKVEAEYFARANTQSFERPYGWAWLLEAGGRTA